MGIPVRYTVNRTKSRRETGFTLIEVLVAVGVMGAAITFLLSMFSNSRSLASTNKTNEIAAKIAEEYMNELRVHPDDFIWPNYSDDSDAEGFYAVTMKNPLKHPMFSVLPPTAQPEIEQIFLRDKNLYEEYIWHAKTRLNDASDNYVEVMIQVNWNDGGLARHLCITSLLPRAVAEGVGR